MEPQTIVRLEVNRIQKIKGTLEIVPSGATVTLSGKNKAGKSSVLQAICMALGGKDCVTDLPINDKSNKAHVILETQSLVITRKFTASGGTTLTVKAKDGTELRSPQAILDSLWNAVALDPIKFIRLSETTEGQRKQLETMRKLVGLDFTKLELDRARFYQERTLANRELDTAKAKLASFPADPSAPAEEVRSADLLAELQEMQRKGAVALQEARDHNAANEKVKRDWQTTSNDVQNQENAIQNLTAEIADIERLVASKKSALDLVRAAHAECLRLQKNQEEVVAALHYEDLAAIQTCIDAQVAPINERIAAADETNTKVRNNRRRKEITAEIDKATDLVNALTQSIEKIDQDKQDQIAKAPFPIPGMSVDDSGVKLDGKPFAMGSQAEQLEAAIAIGLALKPGIRVVLIRDASLMDEDTTARIAAIAAAQQAQVWLECVTSDDPAAVLIEDGAIVEK
jgi:hypothetical protein